MKLNLWILPLLLILAVMCQFVFSAEQAVQQRNKNLSGVFLESSTNWLSIQGLEERANAYVKERDKNFKAESVGMSVWIYTQKSEHAVLFSYNSGLGKPFWNVYFGSDGEVSKYESGILSEGATPHTTPTKRQ